MNQVEDFSDGEYEAVIAAATYAIASVEEKEGMKKQRSSVKFSGPSLSKTKSRNEDNKIKLTSFTGSFKRWFTDQEEEDEENPQVPGDSLTAAAEEQMDLKDSSTNYIITEAATDSAPSVEETPTVTDAYLNDTGTKRLESGKEMRPAPLRAPSSRFESLSFGNRRQDEYSSQQSKSDSKADAWEKEQMIKIKNRYDKTMTMIMEWENEKKAKAKRRLERKQNAPEEKRARALQNYEDEILRIEKVAGEARALAEERKRNEETKAILKAEKIRSTGRIPRACCSCC